MPVVCERQPTRQSIEQCRSEPALEQSYLMTYSALAYAQFDRRTREIEVSCGCVKRSQGVQGKLGTIHRSGMNVVHGCVERRCFVPALVRPDA